MDIAYAFTFPFKDANWIKKLLLIGVVSLIPVVGIFVLFGYMAEIIRRTVNNESELLPDLDFGSQMGTGFRLFLVVLVYALPAIVLQLLAYVPQIAFASMAQQSNADTMVAIGSIFTLCCMGIVILYYILLGFILPIAMVKSTLEGTFGAGFKFNENFAILKAGFLNYLIVLLINGFANSAINSVGSMLCGIGLLLTMPYTMAIQGNLLAQAYKVTLDKMAA